MAGPGGEYDDAFRATVFSKTDGAYRFQSHFPTDYVGRPPHIHIRVSADGFQTLVTQHYPSPGDEQGDFDLVLRPLP
jgi:protocatechuate 3,4-dioxygenase beta subunit